MVENSNPCLFRLSIVVIGSSTDTGGLARCGLNRIDHLMGQSYTIIGSLEEFRGTPGKLGITRFSKVDYTLYILALPDGNPGSRGNVLKNLQLSAAVSRLQSR